MTAIMAPKWARARARIEECAESPSGSGRRAGIGRTNHFGDNKKPRRACHTLPALVAVRLLLEDGFNRHTRSRVGEAGPGCEGGWLPLGGLLVAWIQRSLDPLQTGEYEALQPRSSAEDRGLEYLGNIVFFTQVKMGLSGTSVVPKPPRTPQIPPGPSIDLTGELDSRPLGPVGMNHIAFPHGQGRGKRALRLGEIRSGGLRFL
jgi:hypothetical protein